MKQKKREGEEKQKRRRQKKKKEKEIRTRTVMKAKTMRTGSKATKRRKADLQQKEKNQC